MPGDWFIILICNPSLESPPNASYLVEMMMIMVSVSEARCSGAEKGFITMSSPTTHRLCTYSVLSFPLQLYQWESNYQHFCQRRNSEHLPSKCLTLMCDLAMMLNLLFTRGLSSQIGTISIFRQIHEHEIGCQASSVIGKSIASTMVSIAAFTGGFHCAILLEPFQFRVNPPLLFPSHPPPSLPGLNLNRNSQFRSL